MGDITIPLHERSSEGLIVIPENQERSPLEKEIQLVKAPKVQVVPTGEHAGEYAVGIQVSFSPVDTFGDPAGISDDINGLRMTVEEIVAAAKKKLPCLVYLCGGDPMYKWDEEIRHLALGLVEEDFEVIVETSGVTFPDTYIETSDHMWFYHVIKPQLFDAVPEDEQGGYMQYLRLALSKWIDLDFEGHWQFDVEVWPHNLTTTEEQLVKIVLFMTEIYDECTSDQPLIFCPVKRDQEHYTLLKNMVGKFLPNFPGWHGQVQFPLE